VNEELDLMRRLVEAVERIVDLIEAARDEDEDDPIPPLPKC
jgi:hypothetical protein